MHVNLNRELVHDCVQHFCMFMIACLDDDTVGDFCEQRFISNFSKISC